MSARINPNVVMNGTITDDQLNQQCHYMLDNRRFEDNEQVSNFILWFIVGSLWLLLLIIIALLALNVF